MVLAIASTQHLAVLDRVCKPSFYWRNLHQELPRVACQYACVSAPNPRRVLLVHFLGHRRQQIKAENAASSYCGVAAVCRFWPGAIAAGENAARLTLPEQELVRQAVWGTPNQQARALDQLRFWLWTAERFQQVEALIRAGRRRGPITERQQTVPVTIDAHRQINIFVQFPAGYDPARIGDGGTGFTDNVNKDQVGTAAVPIDPRFGALRNNGEPTFTHALRPGSLEIGKGNNSGAPAPNQRGVARPRWRRHRDQDHRRRRFREVATMTSTSNKKSTLRMPRAIVCHLPFPGFPRPARPARGR